VLVLPLFIQLRAQIVMVRRHIVRTQIVKVLHLGCVLREMQRSAEGIADVAGTTRTSSAEGVA
jgi:hypothetical protein